VSLDAPREPSQTDEGLPRHRHRSARRPLLDDVTPFEHDVVARLFVRLHPNGAPLEVIAALFDVTRERIRQIEAQALKKLARACARERVDVRGLLGAFGAASRLESGLEHIDTVEAATDSGFFAGEL
jgi:hypothetical protein